MFSSAIARLNERHAVVETGEDSGFTLIELMVVLLILAILLAIAIPTFLGVTGGANDRATQSNLNTALTTAKSQGTLNGQSYSSLTAATLKTAEPSLNWTTGAATKQGDVSFAISNDGNGIVLAAISKNANKCWYAVDNLSTLTVAAGDAEYGGATPSLTGTATAAPSGPGTFYASGTSTVAAGVNGCTASAAPIGAAPVPWSTNGF